MKKKYNVCFRGDPHYLYLDLVYSWHAACETACVEFDGLEMDIKLIENNTITLGRVLFTYNAVKEDEVTVNKGETVQVLGTNPYNMFFIHRPANQNSPPAEGWVPMYIIGSREGEGSLSKTHWQMFKMKKSAARNQDRGGMGTNDWRSKTLPLMREGRSNKMAFSDYMFEMSPSVHSPLTSIMVQVGDTAILTCRICGRPRPSITWKFKDSILLTPNSRTQITYAEDGFATLQLSQIAISESGEYTCIATSDIGSVVTRATVTVLDRPGPPSKPQVKTQVGTSVHLEWTPPSTIDCGMIQGYTVEYNEVGVEYWQAAIPYVPNTSQVIGDLNPGSTYQFRVSANNKIGMSDPSVPSDYVTIPTEIELGEKDDGNYAMWKTTYDNDFIEIDELERGRFALIKKLSQKCSGQEVAAKCIKKRLVTKEMVETEFNTIQSLQHDSLLQVFDLYETQANLVIIMQLLPHGRLFDYICERQQFDEVQAAEYIRQLLDVLHYLHNCRIAHLDIKPENLMVDIGASAVPVIKLVDFGDARHIYNNYYIHVFNGNPEFMPPEIVGGTPVSLLSDIWSVGVVMYVMLSGVSPFLDESEEETSSNILRNDYCFPEEFFAGISSEAKDLMKLILLDDPSKRPTTQVCLDSPWIKRALTGRSSQVRPMPIDTGRLAHFIERRKHQVLTA